MIATIEIHRTVYPDPKPIILNKEHSDLSVLRNWQDSILEKQNDKVFLLGYIDNFEFFIRGRKEE